MLQQQILQLTFPQQNLQNPMAYTWISDVNKVCGIRRNWLAPTGIESLQVNIKHKCNITISRIIAEISDVRISSYYQFTMKFSMW